MEDAIDDVADREHKNSALPTNREIRARAFDLWERHHCPQGFEIEFWLMAERELRVEKAAEPNGRSRQTSEATPPTSDGLPS